MTDKTKKFRIQKHNPMKVTLRKNGPYIVTGGVPLIVAEICNDNEGYCRTWKTVTRFPVQQE